METAAIAATAVPEKAEALVLTEEMPEAAAETAEVAAVAMDLQGQAAMVGVRPQQNKMKLETI